MTDNIFTNDEIVEAIEMKDDPDHPDALTVSEARVLLGDIQNGIENGWADWMDILEEGATELVYEGDDVLVFADHSGHVFGEKLDLAEIEDRTDRTILSAIHHASASKLTDYSWSTAHPIVVAKPQSFEAGQHLVEAVVNHYQNRGLSPGQAWAVYGVKIRGNSRNMWAHRVGDSDHSQVAKAYRKAAEKIPL